MRRNMGATRRVLLASLSALPMALPSVRSEAQPRQLELLNYFLGPSPALLGNGTQLFADKAAEGSAGTIQVSIEIGAFTVPFQGISKGSAFAFYYVSEFIKVEPILELSSLPMLTATFDEAETLLQIAKPYYAAALARHGQILLATEPWRPTTLWSNFPIRSVSDFKGVPFAHSTVFGQRTGGERTFIRLGARYGSYSDAAVVLSVGYAGNARYTKEFSHFTEIYFASPLNFLTVSQEVFDSLTEAARRILVGAGRDTEVALWKVRREFPALDHQVIAAHGVSVAAQPPADVLAGLRTAAEPDIQDWARSMGADGAAILAEYRRAIGRQ